MDKKKGILNISVSVGMRLLTVMMSIVVRRQLILTCGNDVNGLNALYLSIIGFLAVAELGAGSAITFCMYRPVVEGDQTKVAALYQLFRKWYWTVGAVILAVGLVLTPFLHHFARDYVQLDVDLYTTFLLMLVSSVLTYMFGAKTALINAHKNNYMTTAINFGGILLQYVFQFVALYAVGTFEAYLICRIIAVAAQWSITEWITRKKYGSILDTKAKLQADTLREVSEKIRGMFMHKIGYFLVNTVDSIVISAFVGVVSLGMYSNYTVILTSMTSIIKLIFTSLTSIFGHMYVQENKESVIRYYKRFHQINFAVALVFYLGYYAVIDNLIALVFSESLVVAKTVAMAITVNGFVQFMRESTLVFRDATGTFFHDRWKPLAEGAVNIVLSIILVREIGVVGVIVATIMTNLLICHIVEPYVIHKYAFGKSPAGHYLRNYSMMVVFFASMLLLDRCMVHHGNNLLELLINGCLSVGISLAVCLVLLLCNIKSWKGKT